VFSIYRILDPVFLQAQYEYLSYESKVGGIEVRDDYDAVFGGAGIATPIGGRASLFAVVLYNFMHDDDDLQSPYSDAWTYRVGVGFGF
jgi:hypothetical protein